VLKGKNCKPAEKKYLPAGRYYAIKPYYENLAVSGM
jgi:hypothetical protein